MRLYMMLNWAYSLLCLAFTAMLTLRIEASVAGVQLELKNRKLEYQVFAVWIRQNGKTGTHLLAGLQANCPVPHLTQQVCRLPCHVCQLFSYSSMNNFSDKWLLRSVWVAKIDQKFIPLHSWHSLILKVPGHLFITLVDYHLLYQCSWMVAMWEPRSSCRLYRLQNCSSWQCLLNTGFASLLLSFVNVISFHCARDFFLADVFLHVSGIFISFHLLLLIAVLQISVQLCRYQA